MKLHMRKWTAWILALALALGCAAASADSVYFRFSIDREAAKEVLPGVGVPEEKLESLDQAFAVLNAAGLRVTGVEDGAQIDLDLNGKNAVSVGYAIHEDGIALVSNLFPNCVVMVTPDTLAKLAEDAMANLPVGLLGAGLFAGGDEGQEGEAGAGEEGTMHALPTDVNTYIANFIQVCADSVVPGDPLPGEYEFEGVAFDTMVPVTVDAKAIAAAFRDMTDEMLKDDSVVAAIQPYMGGMTEEEFRTFVKEMQEHFPDAVTAAFYTNSEGNGSFYMEGQASYEGKDAPSYTYTMLFHDEENFSMTYRDEENGMATAVYITRDCYRYEFSREGLSTAVVITMVDPAQTRCDLYLNTEEPLASLFIETSDASMRTLSAETGERTVVAVEDLMNAESDALSILMNDVMSNGMMNVMPALMQVPEAQGLLTMMMSGGSSGTVDDGDTGDTETVDGGDTGFGMPEDEERETKALRLGTTDFVIRVDATYEERELTEEEIAQGVVACMHSPEVTPDFDICQLPKEDSSSGVKELMEKESKEREAIGYGTLTANNVGMGWYSTEETHNGKEYETSVYLLDAGDEYVRVTFWLEDGNDEGRAEKMMIYISVEPQEAEAEAEAEELPAGRLAGGWQAAEDPAVTEDRQAILDKGLEGLVGVGYAPAAYLGSQVVAGTNHAFLCQGTAVVPDAEPEWKIVFLYEDLQGNVNVMNISDFDFGGLCTYGAEEAPAAEAPAEGGLAGGWQTAGDPAVTEEVRAVLDKGLEGLVGVGYTPVACLGTQVVAGTNYAILCQGTVVVPDAEPEWKIVFLYEDLQGNVTVLNIADFDFGTLCTYGAE